MKKTEQHQVHEVESVPNRAQQQWQQRSDTQPLLKTWQWSFVYLNSMKLNYSKGKLDKHWWMNNHLYCQPNRHLKRHEVDQRRHEDCRASHGAEEGPCLVYQQDIT